MIDADFDDRDCDCSEYEVDTLDGRAWCIRCDRRWWLTDEQLSREINREADFACIETIEAPQAEEWTPPAHWCQRCLADPAEEQGRHFIDTCVSDSCSFKRTPSPTTGEVGT